MMNFQGVSRATKSFTSWNMQAHFRYCVCDYQVSFLFTVGGCKGHHGREGMVVDGCMVAGDSASSSLSKIETEVGQELELDCTISKLTS